MRGLSVVVALVLTGCGTVMPLQTASVVEPHRARVGGQVSVAPFCGLIRNGIVGVVQCTEALDGVPLPELRLGGRLGLDGGYDVGVSARALVQLFSVERTVELGLTVDLKNELLRMPTEGATHIVSVGALASIAGAGRLRLPAWLRFEWGIPVFYGVQWPHVELVASASAIQRFDVSPNLAPSTQAWRFGFSFGVFRREPAGWAIQLGYLADPSRFSFGAIQLQAGWLFDTQRLF